MQQRKHYPAEQKKIENCNQNSKIAMMQSIIFLGRTYKLKKYQWGQLNALWVKHDVRHNIVNFTKVIMVRIDTSLNKLLVMIGINFSKYYSWIDRRQQPNNHNSFIPKKHWMLDLEREAIIKYARAYIDEGYRRLTYILMIILWQ